MIHVNDNFSMLSPSYLFSEIARKVTAYRNTHADADVIRMGIGDVTRPICPAAIEGMMRGVMDEADVKTFHGYGPEQGYEFLRRAIVDNDYKVAVTDPVYPVYVDSNVMAGRGGELLPDGTRRGIEYLPCVAENDFIPALPKGSPDIIYLCYPNNPTGTALTRHELKKWVEYARTHNALIMFDSAYEAYISDSDVPHSIYEIPGAKEVAIEFRSYSKTAGFTGLRCGYTVVPHELKGVDRSGNEVSLNALWLRRQSTKFNGASYVVQRGAEALYTDAGREQVRETVSYYMNNAAILRKGLEEAGLRAWGGVNAPYIWLRTPDGMSSWDFFDALLHRCNVVGTPGAGFGPSGEGYFRLTAFSSHEDTLRAVERIAKFNV